MYVHFLEDGSIIVLIQLDLEIIMILNYREEENNFQVRPIDPRAP